MAAIDPQTAYTLARTLQASTGQATSPDLLANYYQSAVPGTSIDEAIAAANAYLGAQGQPPQAVPPPSGAAPADQGFGTPFQPPFQPGAVGGGQGNAGVTGAPAFGDPASIGQALGQAQSGPISAPFGASGAFANNALSNAILTGTLTGTNPFAGLLNAVINQVGKAGAQSTSVSGIPGISTIGELNTAINLDDPETMAALSGFFDVGAPSNLAALGISSAAGRGSSAGSQAGGVGLTGVEGLSLGAGPSGRSGDTPDAGPTGTPAPADQGIEGTTTGPSGTGAPGDSGGTGGGGTGAAAGAPGDSGGQSPHSGGYIAGSPGGAEDVPATLQRGEFVIPKGPLAEGMRRATGRELKGSKLTGKPGKGLQLPFETVDDLLTRARAYFDVGGSPGPGVPTKRGPR